MAYLFQPVKHVVALIDADNIRIPIERGSWWELDSPTGPMCTWRTDAGQHMAPRRHIKRLILDGDSDHEDVGFA